MKKIIVANWKIYLDRESSLDLLNKIKFPGLKNRKVFDLIVCPPFTAIFAIKRAINSMGLTISMGAQDCFWEAHGAYTGEISPVDLKEMGVEYVIIGHSERRRHLKETDEMVNLKFKAAVAAGLVPIFCVGETAEERGAGEAEARVMTQLESGFRGVNFKKNQRILIAYEPVWAIGTGKSCEPRDAVSMHKFIKKTLNEKLKRDDWPVLYGGSVDEKNVMSYLDEAAIDGVLVGGASAKADAFSSLLKRAATPKV